MPFEIVKLEDIDNEILLDIREVGEYKKGYFNDAINVPLSKLEISVEVCQEFDKSKSYVLYCVRGMRAARAADILKAGGFENIYLLDRGYS